MVYSRNPIFFCLLILASVCFGQSKKLDSLNFALAGHPKEDTVRVQLLLEIARIEFFRDYDSALSLSKEALEIASNLGYTKGMIRTYSLMGNLYHSVGDIAKLSECGMKMIELSEGKNMYRTLGAAGYAHLGEAHSEWGNCDKALYYHKKFLEFRPAIPANWMSIVGSYQSIGKSYTDCNKYDSSIYYVTKALEINLSKNFLPGASFNHMSLASNYFLKGDTDASIESFHEGLRLARKVKATYGSSFGHKTYLIVSFGHLGLAEAYAKAGQYEKAIQYADSALEYSRELNHRVRLRDCYRVLAEIEKSRRHFAKALMYHELHLSYKDSVFSAQKVSEINSLEARFEVREKEQSIQIMDRDRRIANVWKNIAFAIAALIIIALSIAIMFIRYREKKRYQSLNLRIDLLLAENQQLAHKYQYAYTTEVVSTIESQDQRMLNKVVEVVEKNIADPLFGVERLAEELDMSRDSLHRRMKKATGFPPSDFIRSMRLKRAAAMLRSQSDNVAQVGFQVGFNDQSYFSKAFKKHFGISPSDFMKSEPPITTS